nr:hypothetical protein RP007_01614 [Rhizobium sp. P007]
MIFCPEPGSLLRNQKPPPCFLVHLAAVVERAQPGVGCRRNSVNIIERRHRNVTEIVQRFRKSLDVTDLARGRITHAVDSGDQRVKCALSLNPILSGGSNFFDDLAHAFRSATLVFDVDQAADEGLQVGLSALNPLIKRIDCRAHLLDRVGRAIENRWVQMKVFANAFARL